MCEFCIKHGEGKKWYLNIKNYSYDLLSDIKKFNTAKYHFNWIDKNYKRLRGIVKYVPLQIPLIKTATRAIIKKLFVNKHWSQVIPIEDVKEILNFTNSITRIPCVCRKITKGKEYRLCFLLSINPGKTNLANFIDQSFFGGPDVAKFERVTKDWAINFMQENEAKGMIHTIWTIGAAPFIGILCNCDLETGCIPIKMIKDGTPFTFLGEYVAKFYTERCLGCKECVKICPFNAIKLDKKIKKIEINMKKCYGCGICRAACKKNAIYLEERNIVQKHPIYGERSHNVEKVKI